MVQTNTLHLEEFNSIHFYLEFQGCMNQYYWFHIHTKKATHTFTTYCGGDLEEAKKLVRKESTRIKEIEQISLFEMTNNEINKIKKRKMQLSVDNSHLQFSNLEGEKVMTITITMDWLVCLYYLIENILCVYCTDLKMKNYFLQNELYPGEFYCFEMEEEAVTINVSTDTAVTTLEEEPTIISKPIVVQTELNQEAEALLAELQLELSSLEPILEAVEVEEDVPFDKKIDADCIRLSDYETDNVDTTDVSSRDFEQLASAKIGDCLEGEQHWVVSIIGTEEEYLHVSDGHRAWINAGEDAQGLKRGDLLAVDVTRHGRNFEVLNITVLESTISEDYLIPDEEIDFNNSYSTAI
ncbi:hypothetical protein WKH57_24915 [Niallia taxi]|uniref:hypothetical protein n=1 Tax=Niallia taxi TaxID=2499688 RepID=UPI00203FB08B|nr:hypothetical protein [Niallia taxi]MCM3216801.1 hypothetical protein [Niallia taxi]